MKFDRRSALLAALATPIAASAQTAPPKGDKPLPAGKEIPIILQVKMTPDSKAVTEKLNVNLANCPTCKHKEYACICEHGEKGHDHDHEGHDH